MTDPASRYAGLDTATLDLDTTPVPYLRRRFVPVAASIPTSGTTLVIAGDRPDTLAARALGDPTLFWQLADANDAFDPAELAATPGRRLRIPLPPGIVGGPSGA